MQVLFCKLEILCDGELFSCQLNADVYRGRGEEYEGEEEPTSEFVCPFCSEGFDVVGLCCHIDAEHAVEAKNGVHTL